MKHGPSGTFEVSVNGKTVVKRRTFTFPSEQEIVEAVSRELAS